MPLAQTESGQAPSDIDIEPSVVEPEQDERPSISDRITRYGAYDRLEG
jgi:hypothetical protein